MQQRSVDRDFSAYNRDQRGRPVRPLARRAAEEVLAAEHAAAPVAVELGSGAGIEARFLAESGFEVHAIDADPSVEAVLDELGTSHGVRAVITELETVEKLPAAELILSCATLPFVRREAFAALWETVRAALRPGGVLAVDLFGERDDWAGTEGTYLARAEVDSLLEGLEVLDLSEQERDGRSFAGPKHWHTFRILARRPA